MMCLWFAAIIWFTALLNASFKSTDSLKCCRHACAQSLVQRLKYRALTCWLWLIKNFLPAFLLCSFKRVPRKRAILVQTRTAYINNSIFSLWGWKKKTKREILTRPNVKSFSQMQEIDTIKWCVMTCTVFQRSKDPTVGWREGRTPGHGRTKVGLGENVHALTPWQQALWSHNVRNHSFKTQITIQQQSKFKEEWSNFIN